MQAWYGTILARNAFGVERVALTVMTYTTKEPRRTGVMFSHELSETQALPLLLVTKMHLNDKYII